MRKKLALLFAGITLLSGLSLAVPVFAASQDEVCKGIGLVVDDSGNCDQAGGLSVGKVIHTAVSILSYIVGVAAVIMIIIGGFKYVTAGGDSNRISSAKSSISYALIGLVIAAVAQVMVRFVFSAAVAPTPPPSRIPADCQDASCRQP